MENPKLQERIDELEKENNRLRNHNKTLVEDLQKREAWISELSGMRQRSGWDRLFLVGANVVMSLTPERLILNRGTRDSVQDGLYAIVDNAIIGRIANANIFDSQLLLVTHPKSSIPAYIKSVDPDSQETRRILAKLDGLAGDRMRMNISKTETIHVGDPVHAQIQRGLDIPFLVGFVSNCIQNKEAPWLWEVLVKPATPLNDLREVHVLGLRE
jgi:cell shape-determining protein MreC